MSYGLLADLVLVGHLAFIVFVVFGGLLVFRWPKATIMHLPCLAWGVWIEATGRPCPLTPLENRLRRQAGEAGYEAGFIEHYLVTLIYPPGLTPGMQVGLAVLLVTGNALVYALALRKHR